MIAAPPSTKAPSGRRRRIPTPAARAPLATSSANTSTPAFHPSSRKVFDAPGFPDPAAVTSTPFGGRRARRSGTCREVGHRHQQAARRQVRHRAHSPPSPGRRTPERNWPHPSGMPEGGVLLAVENVRVLTARISQESLRNAHLRLRVREMRRRDGGVAVVLRRAAEEAPQCGGKLAKVFQPVGSCSRARASTRPTAGAARSHSDGRRSPGVEGSSEPPVRSARTSAPTNRSRIRATGKKSDSKSTSTEEVVVEPSTPK